MKIAVTLALVANVESGRVARVQRDTDRRYFQLTDMMENYNPTFDERKYWTYGCNCLILGESFSEFFRIFMNFSEFF